MRRQVLTPDSARDSDCVSTILRDPGTPLATTPQGGTLREGCSSRQQALQPFQGFKNGSGSTRSTGGRGGGGSIRPSVLGLAAAKG